MRRFHNPQLELGQTPIERIQFDLHSRDDIPQILRGLQHIYTTPQLREIVETHLVKIIPENVNANDGRRGMDLWNAFVLGTVRTNLSIDYDFLTELANEHSSLRLMLGHKGTFSVDVRYCRQTLKDNLRLLTAEVLDEINQEIVKAGHKLLNAEDIDLIGRCDSFVVKTHVEHPTDIRLLMDAMRKVVMGCGQASNRFNMKDWRQYQHNYNNLNRLYLKALRIKHSTSQDETKKARQQKKIIKYHQSLIDSSKFYLERAKKTLNELKGRPECEALCDEIACFMSYAYYQIDQTERRVVNDETIPHQEKIFSLFEPHTEWISKGKAGVPVELGQRVCIMEDQMGFILHHKVMEQQTDEKVAVEIVQKTLERFENFNGCSFDKGFWKLDNREQLTKLIKLVVLPKKGKWSQKDKEIETNEEFIQQRKQHAAVESAINALEVHGLDVCPDKGIEGFLRYVALAIVARNIQKLGAILLENERKIEKRKRRREKLAA